SKRLGTGQCEVVERVYEPVIMLVLANHSPAPVSSLHVSPPKCRIGDKRRGDGPWQILITFFSKWKIYLREFLIH
ncbi:hypothetical protein, partial [[Eubacterium] cellulosolvens]